MLSWFSFFTYLVSTFSFLEFDSDSDSEEEEDYVTASPCIFLIYHSAHLISHFSHFFFIFFSHLSFSSHHYSSFFFLIASSISFAFSYFSFARSLFLRVAAHQSFFSYSTYRCFFCLHPSESDCELLGGPSSDRELLLDADDELELLLLDLFQFWIFGTLKSESWSYINDQWSKNFMTWQI